MDSPRARLGIITTGKSYLDVRQALDALGLDGQDDLDFYHEVLKWGLDHGLRVPESTRLFLQFSTLDVREYCRSKGYLETFKAVGAEVVSPGCGACNNCGPAQTTSEDQVSITSINRNFPGRSGPGKAWLGSPYTAAASALAGYVTSFDALKQVAETRS